MTPEEKFNQDVWWILQEIKKDKLLAPKDEKVEFLIRAQPKIRNTKTNYVDNSIPDIETQRKLLYKLKDWKAVDVVPVDNVLRGSDIFNPKIYDLTIKQPKFDELYRLYESGGSYSESKNATPEPKTLQSIIKPKSLELIAKEIGELDSGSNLVEFLVNCGVRRELIEYPQTKWRMVNDILITLATSTKPQDQELLFKIIEEASHPLMHGGDEQLAKQTEKNFNKYLKYNGFQLYNYKIRKTTDKTTNNKPLKKIGNVKKECIEELAYELYKEAKKINKISGEHSCKVLLERVVEYPSSSGKDFVDKTCQNTEITLKHFKKEKIIKDYSIECGTIEAETIDGEIYTTDGAKVQCKFYPQKAIDYLKTLYEPKKIFAEKLAKLYLKLINIIELYFQKPIIRDEKLNRFYLKISDEIKQLLNTNTIPELNAYNIPMMRISGADGEIMNEVLPYKNVVSELKTPYHKPFSSLFSAQKEIEENRTNLQAVINSLNAFYGEIHKFVSLYDIEGKEKNEIEEVDKYLNSLRAQKEKQKKESTPSKIEIVGMPEIKIKSSEDKSILTKGKIIKLKSQRIEFDDDKATIKIGKQNVALPPYKNEHYFCQAVFEYKSKEPISWDIIFDKMTGHSTISGGKKPEPVRENWQKVNDTMKRINNRIKEVINTDDDLFSWSEKMVIRNY